MTEENFRCNICGKSFDSKRGLSVHQSQMHDGEEETEDTEVPEPYSGEEDTEVPEPYADKESSDTISLSVRHVMIGVFILGLAVGFSTGIAASNFQGLSEAIDFGEQTEEQESEESTTSVMKDIANKNGIDSAEMEQYIESSSAQEIQEDKQEIGEAVGSLGTPTFFIGNSEIGYTQVSGAQPYSRMKPIIDRKLDEAENGDTTIGDDEYTLDSIGFEGEPVMGEESAPINIIEYSDFGCPWCAEWHGVDAIPQRPIDQEHSFDQVKTNYVETGDVQFVAKDYPVPRLHPEAITAHKAANYVWKNQPDQYWEFSQSIYEERDRW